MRPRVLLSPRDALPEQRQILGRVGGAEAVLRNRLENALVAALDAVVKVAEGDRLELCDCFAVQNVLEDLIGAAGAGVDERADGDDGDADEVVVVARHVQLADVDEVVFAAVVVVPDGQPLKGALAGDGLVLAAVAVRRDVPRNLSMRALVERPRGEGLVLLVSEVRKAEVFERSLEETLVAAAVVQTANRHVG